MRIAFTKHALSRMRIRSINKQMIIETITTPQQIITIDNKIHYRKKFGNKAIEVVTQTTQLNIKIITAYWVRTWK